MVYIWSWNRNRNHNFSTVGTGTGTVKNSYGSTTLENKPVSVRAACPNLDSYGSVFGSVWFKVLKLNLNFEKRAMITISLTFSSYEFIIFSREAQTVCKYFKKLHTIKEYFKQMPQNPDPTFSENSLIQICLL
jgi:hypothetical protein